MFKKILALTAVSLAASTAMAQSSVTLYGVADVGIEYANHQPNGGNSVVRVASGNYSGSRWGLRGTEDLGGGLKALFTLESGFNIDDGTSGQGNRLFGRQAWIGLQNQYGTLSLGRHTTLLYDLSIAFDPMVIATRYSLGSIDGAMGGRADNSIKYVGKFGGFSAKALYSFGADGTSGVNGEVPGHSKVGREYSMGLGYEAGPFGVTAVYDEIAGNTIATENNKTRRAAAAASYVIGPVKTFIGYRYARIIAPPTNGITDLVWAGATWSITPAWSLTGAAYYQNVRDSGADPWLFVASADYAFSKRTDAYLNVAYARNKEGSNLGVTSFGSVSPGANQFATVLGIRHKF